MRAEQGFPVHAMENMPNHHILVDAFGTRTLGTNNLVALTLYRWFNRSYTSNPMPHQLEGFKLSERSSIAPRRLFFALLGVSAFAAVMVFGVIAYIFYNLWCLEHERGQRLGNRFRGTRLQRTPTLALLSDRAEFLRHWWYRIWLTLFDLTDVYASAFLLVALSSDWVCRLQRLGHALLMELYAGEFDYQVECFEDWRTASVTAVSDVRDWVDVRRFYGGWYLEPRECRDTATDV